MLLLALKCTFVEVGQLIIHDQAFVPFYPGVPEDNTKTYYEYMWPLSPCIWLRLLRGHTKNMLWFKSCVPQLRTHIVCVTQKSAISILNKLIFFSPGSWSVHVQHWRHIGFLIRLRFWGDGHSGQGPHQGHLCPTGESRGRARSGHFFSA